TGGAGTDTISGFEDLIGSTYDDTLTGDSGNNIIEGLSGDDTMSGGSGTDAANYVHAAAGVTVDLSNTSSQNTVGAGTDTISGFENLIGSFYDDTLTGDSGANVIFGSAGDDTIVGGTGNDTLDGGWGTDTVSFAGASAVTANLATGTATG